MNHQRRRDQTHNEIRIATFFKKKKDMITNAGKEVDKKDLIHGQ